MSTDQYYLSDWMDNKLSDAALLEIEGPEALARYQKIKTTSAALTLAVPESLEWEHFSKKLPPKSRPKIVRINRYYAVAALLLIMFGLRSFFLSTTLWSSQDQFMEVALPDGSIATLAPGASLSHNRLYGWLDRTLTMEGEVTFEVQKGTPFRVQAPQGEIEVLGTVFKVLDGAGFFQVLCTEGKVRVTHQQKEYVLTPGKEFNSATFRVSDFDLMQFTTANTLYYNRVPLTYVVELIARSYNIKIDLQSSKNYYFTGIIPLNKKEDALQSVVLPFALQLEQATEGEVIIRE